MSAASHFHAVRFYRDSDSLAEMVATFLADGPPTAPLIVIATPLHRAAILNQVVARSGVKSELRPERHMTLLDAEEILAEIMRAGMPDAVRFHDTMSPLIETARRERPDGVIRAYGEMVDVLWKRGETMAATYLEMLWNQLAQSYSFSLLCGYSMGSFYKEGARAEITHHHTHVLSDTGEAVRVTEVS